MGPTLPSLPTEIVSKISQHLISGPTNSYATDMDALYGLRLTCRALNSKTLYDFSKAAFSSLIVDFFPASLDRLHAISQHPDLGKAVKCLHFAHHAEPTVSLGEEEVDPDAVPLEARVQGILRAGLGQIFTGLPNLSEVVIITPLAAIFRQWRSVTAHPPHVSEMRNEIEEANEREPAATIFTEQWALTANFLHQLVLEAADKANIELQSLEVRAPAIYPTTNLNARFAPAYAVCIHALDARHSALNHLRQLHLSLPTDDAPICGQQCPIPEVGLVRALQQMPHLSDLSLNFVKLCRGNSFRSANIMRSLATLHLPCLSRFGLSHVTAEGEALTAFLLNHKGSLRRLLLQCIKFASAGSWRLLLTSLLINHIHKLTELYVEVAYEGDKYISVPLRVYNNEPGLAERLRDCLIAIG